VFCDIAENAFEEEYGPELAYQVKCVEYDIPLLGFFHGTYSLEHPFQIPVPVSRPR